MMKQLYSQTLLLWCSLTFCVTAGAQQTWRLTNDAYSDSLPKITRDDNGAIHVVWLRNEDGDFDVCENCFNGNTWTPLNWIHRDALNQSRVETCINRLSNSMWIIWDSSTTIQGELLDCMTGTTLYYPSIFQTYSNVSRLVIKSNANDSTYLGLRKDLSTYLLKFSSGVWDTGRIIQQGGTSYEPHFATSQYSWDGISFSVGDKPVLMSHNIWRTWPMGYWETTRCNYWNEFTNGIIHFEMQL